MQFLITEQQTESLVQLVLNKEMPKKFDWWKGIELFSLKRMTLRPKLMMFHGKLKVDSEWAGNQCLSLYDYKMLDFNDETNPVLLSEIVSNNEADKIRETLSDILTFILSESTFVTSLNHIEIELSNESVIEESYSRNTIVSEIDNNGLLHVLKLLNISYTKLFSMIGYEWLTNKVMIGFIQDIVGDYLSFGLVEIGEDPIFYNENKQEYREIEYLGKLRVSVGVYDKTTNNHIGEFNVSYHNLNDNHLKMIFDAVMNAYEKNVFENS
jgi:hypothetical protein